ncbi:UNVERIFIED_CONTAM: Agmatine coumaroyltransferase-2, partial [Sesamum latifolium]
ITPPVFFDKVTYDQHVAVIYAYNPPTPPNVTIELGLRKALAAYREWAGRLGRDGNGEPIILLNDEGVRFVEASVDRPLSGTVHFQPSATLLSLHPSLEGVVELVQVQVTRFSCGSIVVGFTAHHLVADGHATSSFLVAWGQACRGLDVNPMPFHDQFSKLKARASNDGISTFESLVASFGELTKARNLNGLETTQVRISVDGRYRLNPRVPNEYFGNLVLWAFARAKVNDLLHEPLPYAVKLLHEAVMKVDDSYFKSFIDFANHKVKKEDLVPNAVADTKESILWPNLEVDSWLRFPFYDLDFGCGGPYIFMPSFSPTEGMIFLLPSFTGDGSIDVFVPLFQKI